MKILELLLPKNLKDKDLSPKTVKKIDNLQQRMNKYVDKISDPTTSKQGKDFLKAKLKSDYEELKGIIEDTINEHVVKHGSGYRLVSKKGKNLGDFKSKKAAGKHEGEVEWFKAHPKESINEGDVIPFKKPTAPISGQIFSGSTYFMDKYAIKAIQKAGLKILSAGGPNDGDTTGKDITDYGHDEDIREIRVEGPQDKIQKVDAYLCRAAEMSGDEEAYGGSYPASDLGESDLPPVEPIQPTEAFEVYDPKTNKVVGGPYASRSRARARADKLDNAYGAYRYRVRRVGSSLTESVNKLPLTDGDFEIVKQVMSHPIPAVIAPIYLQEILDDDEFSAMLQEWEETSPAMDVRPHVVEWFKRVMPDQMHRFLNNEQTMKQKMGLQSVIHGYEPDDYHGAAEESSGNAYGRY
jgi:hypothetical protein